VASPRRRRPRGRRCSEWDDANETWRISRIQYAGNSKKAREKKEKANAAPDASPMRRRKTKGEEPEGPLPDTAKMMSAVYFSYAETEVCPALCTRTD